MDERVVAQDGDGYEIHWYMILSNINRSYHVACKAR